MSTPEDLDRARWVDLAVERVTSGVESDEGIERAAAAVHLALRPPLEPLPRELAIRIADEADRHFAALRAPVSAERRRGREHPDALPRWFTFGGWAAAAASFVAFVGILVLERVDRADTPRVVADTTVAPVDARAATDAALPTAAADAASPSRVDDGAGRSGFASATADEPPSAAEARAALLAAQPFLLRRNWSPAGDAAGRGVTGDVVWDARTQTGYMRFVGLRRNEAGREQYQLWIFDGRRDARYPVDGGVFDVDGSDEVVVPIRARLPVGTPLAFAVTREPAGGVVVSDRERIVVIARSS